MLRSAILLIGYFAGHPGRRGNHHHYALVVQHQGVDGRRPGTQFPDQRLQAGGLFIDGFHLGVGLLALAETVVQSVEKCLQSMVRRGQLVGQFVVAMLFLRGPGGFGVELRPLPADGCNLASDLLVSLIRLLLRGRERNGVGLRNLVLHGAA